MYTPDQRKAAFQTIVHAEIARPGIDDLMTWLDTTDFYTAPASTRFHGSYTGGLCEHSINVYECLKKNAGQYEALNLSDESVAIVSLFHDFCKIHLYTPGTRNVKNQQTGRWESVPTWEFNEEYPAGHGEKSVFLVQRFMHLTDDEVLAIRWHMGGFDSAVKGGDRSISAAYEKCPLAALLHMSDFEASYLRESSTQN